MSHKDKIKQMKETPILVKAGYQLPKQDPIPSSWTLTTGNEMFTDAPPEVMDDFYIMVICPQCHVGIIDRQLITLDGVIARILCEDCKQIYRFELYDFIEKLTEKPLKTPKPGMAINDAKHRAV